MRYDFNALLNQVINEFMFFANSPSILELIKFKGSI